MLKHGIRLGRIASICLLSALAASGFAPSRAMANANITAIFGTGYSTQDQTVVNAALAFFNTNIATNFSTVIDFGTQAAGGASSVKLVDTFAYQTAYNALAATATSPIGVAAVASLGLGGSTNPVNGSSNLMMTDLNGSILGLNTQATYNYSAFGCQSINVNACITIGTSSLNGSSPTPDLFGVTQHEIDEILGTSSALPNGGGAAPANPSITDLYRYSASGVRSFATNASTSAPCTSGTPTAYLSLNGGATNLSNYNNCNNGADYGDFANNAIAQVQDAYGSLTTATSLTVGSPEVSMLQAIGYTLVTTNTSPNPAPEPASIGIVLIGLAGLYRVRRKPAA